MTLANQYQEFFQDYLGFGGGVKSSWVVCLNANATHNAYISADQSSGNEFGYGGDAQDRSTYGEMYTGQGQSGGGGGWYGGYAIKNRNGNVPYSASNGSGGSSYVLTETSYKPTYYMATFEDIMPSLYFRDYTMLPNQAFDGPSISIYKEDLNGPKAGDTILIPYTGERQQFSLLPGTYRIKCYGGDGGVRYWSNRASKGGYTEGILHMRNNGSLFAYVGSSAYLSGINCSSADKDVIFNNKMSIVLTGGYGWHTKFPTIGQLYPETVYIDLVEMNYWHENRDCRGIYTQTYIADATNYNLEPARNKKKEVRIDISCKGNRLSVTFFNEDMKSGFRSMTEYRDYPYKKYDISGIDAATLTSVPDPHTLPYKIVHELNGFSKTCNGSRTQKQGVEYTISTIRMPKTNTRLTINGAYFKTVYENSMEIQEIPNSMVFGDKIHYAGVYNDDDGYIRETNNTNFTFDTDIPSIHLGVSLSAQCVWQTASQSAEKQNTPIAYIDNTGERHEFTDDAVEADPLLKFLIRTYNASLYERQTVPFAMNINMKATKSLINDKLMVALFVYKLLDAHPSYVRNGYEIRRYAKPYFGLEMNLKL